MPCRTEKLASTALKPRLSRARACVPICKVQDERHYTVQPCSQLCLYLRYRCAAAAAGKQGHLSDMQHHAMPLLGCPTVGYLDASQQAACLHVMISADRAAEAMKLASAVLAKIEYSHSTGAVDCDVFPFMVLQYCGILWFSLFTLALGAPKARKMP